MKPVWIHSRILVAGLCASLFGCGDPAAPDPAGCTTDSRVTVTVGPGSSPWISWSPSLLVHAVELHDRSNNDFPWAATSEWNDVASPIRVAAALAHSSYEIEVLCLYPERTDGILATIGTKVFAR